MAESATGARLQEPRVNPGGKSNKPHSSQVEVDLAGQTHPGNLRSKNEDHYLAVRAERTLQAVLSNLPKEVIPHSVDETAYGMIVADGLGSLPAGELASAFALRTLVELVANTPDWIMRMNPRKAAQVKRRMIQRFRQIDLALKERGRKDPRLAGMGTTLTVAISLGADLFVGHLGDSRAYLLRDGELFQITKDHTLARAMIDAGVTTGDDHATHEMRRVLTAALGASTKPYEPQVKRFSLRHGDQLLLCTDGLTESLDIETIGSILQSEASADQVCDALISAALSKGGTDNITVLLARYRFPQPNS